MIKRLPFISIIMVTVLITTVMSTALLEVNKPIVMAFALSALIILFIGNKKKLIKANKNDNNLKLEKVKKISIPLIDPKLNKYHYVKSHINPNIIYMVNPYLRTCSCSSSRRRSKKFRKDDVRYMCRHLRKLVFENLPGETYDETIKAFLQNGVDKENVYKININGENIYIAKSANRDSIDILSKSEEKNGQELSSRYRKYKFNTMISQWASDSPEKDIIIRKIIENNQDILI